MNIGPFSILKKSILFLQLEMKVINHSCEKMVPRNPGTQEPRNPGTRVPRCPGTQEPRNPGTQEPRYPGTKEKTI